MSGSVVIKHTLFPEWHHVSTWFPCWFGLALIFGFAGLLDALGSLYRESAATVRLYS
jgi:hypothetical protein